MWTYKAEVKRVVDGDTYDMIVDLGFYVYHKIRVRLRGVDTPEVFGKNASPEGTWASDFVKELIEGKVVTITTTKSTPTSYNRWEATVLLEDGRDLGEVIVEEGHGVIDERFI